MCIYDDLEKAMEPGRIIVLPDRDPKESDLRNLLLLEKKRNKLLLQENEELKGQIDHLNQELKAYKGG